MIRVPEPKPARLAAAKPQTTMNTSEIPMATDGRPIMAVACSRISMRFRSLSRVFHWFCFGSGVSVIWSLSCV